VKIWLLAYVSISSLWARIRSHIVAVRYKFLGMTRLIMRRFRSVSGLDSNTLYFSS
jgi:hypothetical protein